MLLLFNFYVLNNYIEILSLDFQRNIVLQFIFAFFFASIDFISFFQRKVVVQQVVMVVFASPPSPPEEEAKYFRHFKEAASICIQVKYNFHALFAFADNADAYAVIYLHIWRYMRITSAYATVFWTLSCDFFFVSFSFWYMYRFRDLERKVAWSFCMRGPLNLYICEAFPFSI